MFQFMLSRQMNSYYDEIKNLIDDMREGLYQGFNVTIPYKQTVIQYLDILTSKNILKSRYVM